VAFGAAAFALAVIALVWRPDAAPAALGTYGAISTAGLAGGWGHNALGKWTQQTTSYEAVPMGRAWDDV